MIRKLLNRYYPDLVNDIKSEALDEWMRLKVRESTYEVHIVHTTYEDDDYFYTFGVIKKVRKDGENGN